MEDTGLPTENRLHKAQHRLNVGLPVPCEVKSARPDSRFRRLVATAIAAVSPSGLAARIALVTCLDCSGEKRPAAYNL